MKRPEPSKWREARGKAIERHLAELPEAERRDLELDRKEAQQTARARYAANREEREKRNKRFLELLLRGYTQAEIAKATGAHEITVSRVLSSFSPLSKPGRDNRWVAMRLSPDQLTALDVLASELLIDRMRVLEMIGAATLEQRGFHARRLLRLPGAP